MVHSTVLFRSFDGQLSSWDQELLTSVSGYFRSFFSRWSNRLKIQLHQVIEVEFDQSILNLLFKLLVQGIYPRLSSLTELEAFYEVLDYFQIDYDREIVRILTGCSHVVDHQLVSQTLINQELNDQNMSAQEEYLIRMFVFSRFRDQVRREGNEQLFRYPKSKLETYVTLKGKRIFNLKGKLLARHPFRERDPFQGRNLTLVMKTYFSFGLRGLKRLSYTYVPDFLDVLNLEFSPNIDPESELISLGLEQEETDQVTDENQIIYWGRRNKKVWSQLLEKELILFPLDQLEFYQQIMKEIMSY